MAKCKWCGSEYEKKHNREEYCCEEHRKYARQEQNRYNFRNYYYKYKDGMNEKERCGLGSGFLGMHRHEDFTQELIAIKREKEKIGIQ